MPRLPKHLQGTTWPPGVIPGEVAFYFHDTLGLDIEELDELAVKCGRLIDKQEFDRLLVAQRERSRTLPQRLRPVGNEISTVQ